MCIDSIRVIRFVSQGLHFGYFVAHCIILPKIIVTIYLLNAIWTCPFPIGVYWGGGGG